MSKATKSEIQRGYLIMLKFITQTLFLFSLSFQALSDVEEFIQPHIDGMRLDWCLSYSADCGEQVAYKWCINHGFNKPIYWLMDKNIGEQSPTITLNSRESCYKKTCSSFQTIICYKKG